MCWLLHCALGRLGWKQRVVDNEVNCDIVKIEEGVGSRVSENSRVEEVEGPNRVDCERKLICESSADRAIDITSTRLDPRRQLAASPPRIMNIECSNRGNISSGRRRLPSILGLGLELFPLRSVVYRREAGGAPREKKEEKKRTVGTCTCTNSQSQRAERAVSAPMCATCHDTCFYGCGRRAVSFVQIYTMLQRSIPSFETHRLHFTTFTIHLHRYLRRPFKRPHIVALF